MIGERVRSNKRTAVQKELRMAGGWMLLNQYRNLEGLDLYPVVDLGEAEYAEPAFNELTKLGIPKNWFSMEGGSRLLCGVPFDLHETVRALPQVQERGTYWNIPWTWCNEVKR